MRSLTHTHTHAKIRISPGPVLWSEVSIVFWLCIVLLVIVRLLVRLVVVKGTGLEEDLL